MRAVVPAAVVVALLSVGSGAGAAVELVRHELRVAGSVQNVLAEDLDGDGQRELLVFSVSGERDPERRVSIFTLDAGALRSEPHVTWAIDPEAGMLDIGHDPDDGPSLWYCTASAVRRYRLRRATLQAPTAEQWLDAPNLLGGRSDEWVLFHDFVRDWRGDGAETPAVFQPGRVILPRRDPSAAADVVELRTEIDLPNLPTINDMPSRLPLYISHRIPAVSLVDANGDGKNDLVAALGDRLEVHAGTDNGGFARQANRVVRLPSAADPRDETRRHVIQLDDVTGDGKVDAVLTTITGGIGNLTQSIDIFPGTGRDFAATPSATMTTDGAASLTVLADIDGDVRPEITTVSIKIGVRSVLSFLLTRHMPVEFATYSVDRAGKLDPQPLLQWTRPLRLNLSGPTDPGIVSIAGDFDGDGLRDLVSAPDDDEVDIRRIVRGPDGLSIGEVLASMAAPGRGQALATDLNADGRSDLVVYAPRRPEGVVTVFLSSAAATREAGSEDSTQRR